MPSGGSTTSEPAARSTTGTIAETNGTSSSDPSGRVTASTGDAGGCHTSHDRAEHGAGTVEHGQPDKLVVVELVRVVGHRQRRASRVSSVPRSVSAASRSVIPSKPSTSTGPDRRIPVTVSGPLEAGRCRAPRRRRTWSSGSSVLTWTVTSPRKPCGRPIRPTTTSTAGCRVSGRCRRRRPGCPARRPRTSRSAARWRSGRRGRSPCPGRPGGPGSAGCGRGGRSISSTLTSSALSTMPRTRCSRASSSTLTTRRCSRSGAAGVSAAGASAAAASAAGAVRLRFGVVADDALVAADGGHRGVVQRALVGLRLRGPQGALGTGQALELLPVAGHLEQRASTDSVGCAPTPSQYCARSESISMTLGSAFGWYRPMFSMARPLRRVRASATTMR